jgi:hypothetical protein
MMSGRLWYSSCHSSLWRRLENLFRKKTTYTSTDCRYVCNGLDEQCCGFLQCANILYANSHIKYPPHTWSEKEEVSELLFL